MDWIPPSSRVGGLVFSGGKSRLFFSCRVPLNIKGGAVPHSRSIRSMSVMPTTDDGPTDLTNDGWRSGSAVAKTLSPPVSRLRRPRRSGGYLDYETQYVDHFCTTFQSNPTPHPALLFSQ
ncbi:hypothetical protein Trydic_g22529 [Trypoxylus dichotomus]